MGAVVADFANKNVFSVQETETVRALTLTPDGRMAAFAISGRNSREGLGFIRIWDLDVPERVREFDEEDPEIHSIAITADGRILAAARHFEDFRIWDVARGECLLTLFVNRHVRAAAITPDGHFAVCGGDSGDVWLLDLANARVVRRFTGNFGRIYAVALTPDGRFVAAFDCESCLSVWDVKTGSRKVAVSVPAKSDQLLLSTNASLAVVGAHVIDLRSVTPLSPEPRPIVAAMTQDGTIVAFAREDGSLALSAFGGTESRVIFHRSDFDPGYAEFRYGPIATGLNGDGRGAVLAFSDGRLYSIDLAASEAHEIIPRAELERLVAQELPHKF
jgi:WD40 repeat protein